MAIEALVIDTSTAHKDGKGRILVHYDKQKFPKLPNTLVTPMTEESGQTVNSPLAVTEYYDGMVAISGAPSNSLINVVFVAGGTTELYGLPALTRQTNKSDFSVMVDSYHDVSNHASNIITPLVRPESMPLSFVETTGVTKVSLERGEPHNQTNIMSESGRLAYVIYSLSAKRADAVSAEGHLGAQAGVLTKDKTTIRVPFPKQWDTLPVVLVTPAYTGRNQAVTHAETVTKVTKDYFEVTSGNHSPANLLNWLALSPELHRPSRKHLDDAFEHFLGHFPEHRQQVQKHRKDLERIILRGEDPSTLGEIPFDNRPSLPKATRAEPEKLFLDFASLLIDSVGLILSAIGIPVGARASAAVRSTAEALEVTERTSLFTAEFEQALIEANNAGEGLESAKANAALAMKASVIAWHFKLLKSILTALAEHMTWQEWVIMGVKLAAAIGLIIGAAVLTGGASIAAAGGAIFLRIVGTLLAGYALEQDIERLIHDWPK